MRFREKVAVWRGEALMRALMLFRAIARVPGLRAPYLALLRRLVKKTGLFDAAHYLEVHRDVAEAGFPPLRHYVAFGDREGRSPMPLLEPHYYRSKAPGRSKHVNALLHYYYIGQYRRFSPSAWFDVQYYLAQNKDVRRASFEPINHYLKFGGLEGRSPNPQFDGVWYLEQHPELVASRINPLLHYIKVGREQQFPTRPGIDAAYSSEVGGDHSAHSILEKFEGLAPLAFDAPPEVDIVVPVYKDRLLTLRCLYSVLTAPSEVPFELIVINDASPDPELVRNLEQLAARGLFTLLNNTKNCGFVASVNRGMALNPDRDVVLLNADAEVYNNWLERLHNTAYRQRRTASVTPLSNNATICSYPRFLHDNPYPLELDYALLDRLAAEVNAGIATEAPTGVGFCMYVQRAALVKIGLFDEATFGKGYGEENDWCQRAIEDGWTNLIAADVFVRHLGSASFLGEKGKRVADAMKLLARKHPTYEAQVRQFIAADPLFLSRQRLDMARLRQQTRPTNVLMACHNRGGGAEKHLQEDTARVRAKGRGVFFLRPVRGQPGYARIQHPSCRQLLNLQNYRLSDTETLGRALQDLGITCIHSHGLVDFESDAAVQLLKVARHINVPLHVDIHDYKVICPRINLVDEEGFYCGEPDEAACNACLGVRGNDFGAKDIRAWRKDHYEVLRATENIWVPDSDVAARLNRYYPEAKFLVVPHEEDVGAEPKEVQPIRLAPGARMHIVVIGAIGMMKGYRVLLGCARDAKARQLPIDFSVMGYTMNDALLQAAGVNILGKYDDNDAQVILKKLDPHLVWLPSIWPETYSYTLSIAQRAGYHVVAFDIGAIARRIKATGGGALFPIGLATEPARLNDQFISIARTPSPKN